MPDERGVTHYDLMPIPPIETHTQFFEAGSVVIGVEYRLLDDAIAAASNLTRADGAETGTSEKIDDRGVSIHVYAVENDEQWEQLRFDCFEEDPHYHYVSWKEQTNQMIHMDCTAVGDPVDWALNCIRTRLPQMLRHTGAHEAADQFDPLALQAIIPRVAEAAYRARFDYDEEAIRQKALGRAVS